MEQPYMLPIQCCQCHACWCPGDKGAWYWPPKLEYSVSSIKRVKIQHDWCKLSYHWISLTHWGRVTHICVGNLTIIASDNGLSPGRRQAIIWTSAGILLIGPLGTNFSEISIEIQTFLLKKIRLKMLSAECCPFRLGLNVLRRTLHKENMPTWLPRPHFNDPLHNFPSLWGAVTLRGIRWQHQMHFHATLLIMVIKIWFKFQICVQCAAKAISKITFNIWWNLKQIGH